MTVPAAPATPKVYVPAGRSVKLKAPVASVPTASTRVVPVKAPTRASAAGVCGIGRRHRSARAGRDAELDRADAGRSAGGDDHAREGLRDVAVLGDGQVVRPRRQIGDREAGARHRARRRPGSGSVLPGGCATTARSLPVGPPAASVTVPEMIDWTARLKFWAASAPLTVTPVISTWARPSGLGEDGVRVGGQSAQLVDAAGARRDLIGGAVGADGRHGGPGDARARLAGE